MCSYSMIADYYTKYWTPPLPNTTIQPNVYQPNFQPYQTISTMPTPEQITALKYLLRAAKEMDKATGEADCEDPEKVKKLQELGALDPEVLPIDGQQEPENLPHFVWTHDDDVTKLWRQYDGLCIGEVTNSLHGFWYAESIRLDDPIGEYLTKEMACDALEQYAERYYFEENI